MRKAWLFLWTSVGFLAIGIIFMVIFINPVVAGAANAKIEAMTVKAVNRAISNIVTASTYRELTDVRYDVNGKITSLSTNMLQMNGLSSDIANTSQGFLEMFASTGIPVPIGTFSGAPILVGKGPNVTLRVVPVGSSAKLLPMLLPAPGP